MPKPQYRDSHGRFITDIHKLAQLSATIRPGHHPDPDRDIWAETAQAVGFDPYEHGDGAPRSVSDARVWMELATGRNPDDD